jgi:hypothetical protein
MTVFGYGTSCFLFVFLVAYYASQYKQDFRNSNFFLRNNDNIIWKDEYKRRYVLTHDKHGSLSYDDGPIKVLAL